MTLTCHVDGHIAEPKIAFTQNGRPILNLRINATRRTKNTNTNQWEDDGDPLWITITLWDNEADTLADKLQKGDRITAAGTLTLKPYTRNDGTPAIEHQLRNPKILTIQHKNTTPTPNQNDPWNTQPPF